jgi:hypothetical protein
MTFDKLKPGMVVYDVHSYRMGNTTLRSVGVWQVQIVSVDAETQTVIASWNHNTPEKYRRRTWEKWRLKEPKLVNTGMWGQQRLAKRGE